MRCWNLGCEGISAQSTYTYIQSTVYVPSLELGLSHPLSPTTGEKAKHSAYSVDIGDGAGGIGLEGDTQYYTPKFKIGILSSRIPSPPPHLPTNDFEHNGGSLLLSYLFFFILFM